MQVFLDDLADLGQPPSCYESAEAFRADIERLGKIVAESGDFSEVEVYARWICSHAAGAESVLAFAIATPNFCWDMDRDSPLYAVECFTEEVSNAAEACKSAQPTKADSGAKETEDAVPDPVAASEIVADPLAKRALAYFVFLNDGDTYSGLDGCVIVGINSSNRRARRALEAEDFETLFERADLVEPVAVPAIAG